MIFAVFRFMAIHIALTHCYELESFFTLTNFNFSLLSGARQREVTGAQGTSSWIGPYASPRMVGESLALGAVAPPVFSLHPPSPLPSSPRGLPATVWATGKRSLHLAADSASLPIGIPILPVQSSRDQ